MIRLGIHEVETHLSRYLSNLSEGDVIVLCQGDEPIAEIHPIKRQRVGPRPIGLCAGQFTVPQDFFEPLPGEILDAFEGGGK